MKLLNLAKRSAKEVFKLIRSDGSYFCGALHAEVKITRKFLQHICFNYHKDRTAPEIMERILIMPFVPKILKDGRYSEARNEYGVDFIRIALDIPGYILVVIIEKKEERYVLLSCFRENKKRPVSASRTGTSSA